MSASTPTFAFSVPPGHSPPLFVVTDTDHTGWIIIATSLGLVCTLVFGGIRAIVRRSVSPGLGLDDAFITVSTILTIIQSAVVLAGCSYGFGKSVELVPLRDQDKVQKFYYVGNQLFLIALGLSKLSVIFLLLRLAIATHHRRVLHLAVVFTTVWMCASFLAVTFQCNLAHPWIILGQRCSGTFLRWKIISAFDVITEISTIGICAQLVWNLHCPVSTKATVLGAFSFRLLIIIAIALRLSTFDETHQISNFTLVEDLFVVWTQTELNYSLISATIPTLRRFALSLNTRFGGLQEVESEYSRGNSDDYGHRVPVDSSYEAKSFVSSDKSKVLDGRTITEHAPDFTKGPIMRTSDTCGQTTRIATGNGSTGTFNSRTGQIRKDKANWESTSVGSNESQHMIIKTDVRYGLEDLVIQQASLRPHVQY